MYAAHFGLNAEPFSLTPDPAFLFLSPGHAEALAALEIGLRARRGLIVMTGEVGTGKTTLLYTILQRLGPQMRTAYIQNTSVCFDAMLRQALADLGVTCAGQRREDLLAAFNGVLLQSAADDASVVLVVDEAQNLSDETIESLRLLSNYETFTTKLLQIVLVGQPELESKLRNPRLRQIAERVAVRCHVNPLSWGDSRHYAAHRLEGVGGGLDVFSPAALRLLLWKARGIPRRINILCHNALLFAYGRTDGRVSLRAARAAVREHDGRGRVSAWWRGPVLPPALRVGGRWPLLAAAVLLSLVAAGGATRWLGRTSMVSQVANAREVRASAPQLSVETAFAGTAQVGSSALVFPTRLTVETWFPDSAPRRKHG